ncbi:hypothetical protein [Mycolicibacterium sp.]|uniref:hypothetical protein n=1 Tax=Mycolicibacterium sp. TaxID=2320850 RepID=UPI0037CA99A2
MPSTSVVLLAAAVVVWLIGFIVVIWTKSATVERRAYWTGYLGVAVLAALAFLFNGWFMSMLISTMVAVTALSHAYFRTNYLVIGGKVISATSHRQPDDATTAADGRRG